MYIARYQSPDRRSLYQLLVSFPKLVVEGGESTWAVGYRGLIDSILARSVDFAYRIGCSAGQIRRCLLVHSFDHDSIEALASIAGRLNGIVADSAVQPQNLSQHDADANSFPLVRRTICRQPYHAGNFEIPCDFYVFPLASRLLSLALSSKADFALQINCRYHAVSPEELRKARRELADLQLSNRVPAAVIAHISNQTSDLVNRSYLLEESIGVDSQNTLHAVEGVIETAFRQRHAQLGFSGSPLGERPTREEIQTGLHSACMEDTFATPDIWRSVPPAQLGDFLGWIPPESFAAQGVMNAIKASLSQGDLLAHIAHRLDAMESKLARQPGAGTATSLRNALKIGEIDLLAAAGTARGIIEEIVRQIYLEANPAKGAKIPVLDTMIENIRKSVPEVVYTSMHAVRTVGNMGTHRNIKLTRADLETCMMAALRVAEWFLLERPTSKPAYNYPKF